MKLSYEEVIRAYDVVGFCERILGESDIVIPISDRAGALRAEPLRVSGKAAHRLSQEGERGK